jgi:cephalosporin-C deacetylase-like acetyl esterase
MAKQLIQASLLLAVCTACASAQADNTGRQRLIDELDKIANTQLETRAQSIAKIETPAAADQRKTLVRRKILDLMGGLPENHAPLAVKQFGTLTGEGFHVEKLAYESLPGFWVTANLYVPESATGPYPAVLLTPGHEATGKQSQYSFGGNFARAGIMALAIDPLGQGERLQYFDPAKKASAIGGSTGEHGEANIPAMLIGEDVARYFVNDGMRGVDYLTSRKDVNAARIGAFGCSGGGTATAYLAALDDRIKVAGVACYITSFKELLPSDTGVQEAEQSLPHFIEQGLDFPDWVELVAPKPYAIISTTNDMFPFEGARQTYDEVKRIYQLYGADDKLQWITGPGGHGNLGPISAAILGFFIHYLAGGPAGDATFTALRPQHPEDLLCTPTGQVSTSLGGETVASIVRAHAPKPAVISNLREDIRTLTGITVTAREGYRTSAGHKAAVLMLGAPPEDLDRLTKSGHIVVALESRPSPPGTEGLKSPYLGPFNLLSLRAFLVGKTILGLRVEDTIRAIDELSARPDVDTSRISVYGSGPMGPVVLHAAVLDSRIRRVVVEDSLTSYRAILDDPLHKNVSEVVVPGVLRRYDIGDLLKAIAPRPVTVVHRNPSDPLPID